MACGDARRNLLDPVRAPTDVNQLVYAVYDTVDPVFLYVVFFVFFLLREVQAQPDTVLLNDAAVVKLSRTVLISFSQFERLPTG